MYEKEQDSFIKGVETTGSHTRGGRTSHLVLSLNLFYFNVVALKNIEKVQHFIVFKKKCVCVCVAGGPCCSRQGLMDSTAS